MKARSSSEKALEYIESRSNDIRMYRKTGPCITVSRQAGAGSSIIDDKVKEILQSNQKSDYGSWEIFDWNLIEKIMEDHNLPQRLQKLFSHEKQSGITQMVHELLGLQPSGTVLLHKTAHTILQLAQTGNCIIVGRAGNIITSKLSNVFSLRLVAPLEDRIVRMQTYYHIDRKEAIDWIKREDESRKEYYKKNYHRDIDDTLLYHMILNTHHLSYDDSARIIADAVIRKFPEMFEIQKANVQVMASA